jgi:hypothetical protein
MSKVDDFLDDLERSLPYPDPIRMEVVKETRDHLLSLVARYQHEGMSQSEAESKALDSFGSLEDFIAEFEAQGGATGASVPTAGFATITGAYVGLVIGLGVSLVLQYDTVAPAIVGLVLGALFGRGLMLQRNLGPAVGAALGALVGNVAVANYLIAHTQERFGESSPYLLISISATVLGALCGFATGFLPRFRMDPTPLLWATALGLGGHVAARLWLEDFPTFTGLTMLALGLLVGGLLGLNHLARRYATVPLGAMTGLMSGWLLYWSLRYFENALDVSIIRSSMFYLPTPTLVIGASTGTVLGLAIALRSKARHIP